MNDQQIYALMAKTPKIRAVQIADALDQELVDVSNALRSLVEVGDVVQSKGFAPNGLQAQVYDLSDEFKKSKEYRALVALENLAPKDVPAPVVVPVFGSTPPAGLSRIDKAVAYVAEHGKATDSEMRDVMGLTRGEFPSSVLASAVRAGKIHKADGTWLLKKKQPAAPSPVFNPTFTKAKAEPVAQFAPTAQPEEVANVVEVERRAPVTDITPDPSTWGTRAVDQPAVFRCGLWSDGVIELQRNGVQVASLTQREGEHLADFMRRMLGAAEVTT